MHNPQRLLYKISFIVMLFGLTFPSQAQEVNTWRIEGTIVDAESLSPLAGVHVFLASRLQGTTTDGNGKFVLEEVLPGSYKVVASIIGYDSESVVVEILPDQEPGDVAIRLKPIVYELDGVTVVEDAPRQWKKHLSRFEELFLGTSSNAKETKKNRNIYKSS